MSWHLRHLVHAMKAGRGSRGLAPVILSFGSRWKIVVNLTPRPPCHREKALVLIERTSELVRTFLREIFLFFSRIRTANFLARKLSHYTDYALAVPTITVDIQQKQQKRKKKYCHKYFHKSILACLRQIFSPLFTFLHALLIYSLFCPNAFVDTFPAHILVLWFECKIPSFIPIKCYMRHSHIFKLLISYEG
jgi:hypothetical protein